MGRSWECTIEEATSGLTDGGDEVDVRERLLGEDGRAELGDPSQNGRTEDDPAQHLRDHFGLPELGEDEAERLGDREDER